MIRVLINLFIMLLYYGFLVSIKKYKIYQRINNLNWVRRKMGHQVGQNYNLNKQH